MMSNDLSVVTIQLDNMDRRIVSNAINITNVPHRVINSGDDVYIQVNYLIDIIEELTYKYEDILDELRKEVE